MPLNFFLELFVKNNPKKCKTCNEIYSKRERDSDVDWEVRKYCSFKCSLIGRKVKFHDYTTHKELAINSGIKDKKEWQECHSLGFMPDGIFTSPDQAFGRRSRAK